MPARIKWLLIGIAIGALLFLCVKGLWNLYLVTPGTSFIHYEELTTKEGLVTVRLQQKYVIPFEPYTTAAIVKINGNEYYSQLAFGDTRWIEPSGLIYDLESNRISVMRNYRLYAVLDIGRKMCTMRNGRTCVMVIMK